MSCMSLTLLLIFVPRIRGFRYALINLCAPYHLLKTRLNNSAPHVNCPGTMSTSNVSVFISLGARINIHAFAQTVELTFFAAGIQGRSKYSRVRATHYEFGGEFTVPDLNDIFVDTDHRIQTTTFTVEGDQFLMYHHERGDLVYGLGHYEIAMFRRSVKSLRLVNLRPGDDPLLATAFSR